MDQNEYPFNGLTPAEAERLAILIEEAGEVIQIACKILRHGYESYNPVHSGESNREELCRELGDFAFAVELMNLRGDVTEFSIMQYQKVKANTIWQWLHHNNTDIRG